jgi:hypothetical protein
MSSGSTSRRSISRSILVGLFVLSAGTAVPAAPPPCGGVFDAVADASVVEAAPGDNFGSEPELRVEHPGDGTQVWRSLIGFDLGAALPEGATVDSAWLRLSANGVDLLPFELEVRSVTAPWAESELTWTKQPSYGPVYALRSFGIESGDVLLDVTALVTHWATGRLSERSLALLARPPAGVRFLSREGGGPENPGPQLLLSCRIVPSPEPPDPAEGDALQAAAIARLRAASLEPPEIRLARGAIASASFRVVVPAAFRLDPVTRARWFLSEYGDALRAGDPAAAWQLRRRAEDDRHLNFRQLHNGIPVFPGEVIVHLDGEDVVGLSGSYAAALDRALGATAPPLDAARALALARADSGEGAEPAGDVQLAIVDGRLIGTPGAAPRLAWTVPADGPAAGLYAIDATTGQTLHLEDAIQEVFDLTLRTAQLTDPPASVIGCWAWNNSDEEWFDETGQTRFTPPVPDQEGIDAFGHISAIDSYWRTALRRDGHNGGGGQEGLYLDVIIRDRLDRPSNNAMFVPFCNDLRFADGMGTLDIIGHEYTHGVVAAEANLVYENQSGALNESYADLFGYFVDSGNWTIGEGSAGGEFRDLSNPPRFRDPDHMDGARSGDGCGFRELTLLASDPCRPFLPDNGFVHTNSGIPNKAGYLLIHGGVHGGYDVAGLGIPKARRLLYDAIANRLTSGAQLLDQRDQMVAAAHADSGLTPFERCQVRNSYAAVGLGTGDANCDGVPDDVATDDDGDWVTDGSDNCPQLRNPSQADQDGDGSGDGCDPDLDGDGRLNAVDNCPRTINVDQADTDTDGVGEACDDDDGDGVPNAIDKCPLVYDPDQSDTDGDGFSDACEIDDDDDHIVDQFDNCRVVKNSRQANGDGDEWGDTCDSCPAVASSTQDDGDGDGLGDACDDDRDNDGVADGLDNCPGHPNPTQSDFDGDGVGNACDPPEQRRVYEDLRFFELERTVQWPLTLDLPVEIGVPLCPACGGAELPAEFRPEMTVRMSTPFLALLRDAGTGRALAVTAEPALEHQLRFRPESHAFSRFDFGSPGKGGPGGPPPGLPSFVDADQRRYALELYPPPGTDRAATYGVQIQHTQCVDADGDGFVESGLEGCPGPDDCDDAEWRRAPGRVEACDGLDNDCDGFVDEDPARPPGTARLFVRPAAGGPDAASEIWWTELMDVAGYDLVRGSVGELRAGGGDFGTAAETCLANDTTATSQPDASRPKIGDAFFYLVRGASCAGSGTFDESQTGQQGSRDAAEVCGP